MSELSRFLAKADRSDGCWEWRGYRNVVDGYGYMQQGSPAESLPAHRAAYRLFVGPIPAGMHIDHLCSNRGCVNPDHLEPVTPHENSLRAMKTHCKNGHEYTVENTSMERGRFPDPHRRCKTCRRNARVAREALAD